ncbi:hypothetical protein EX30DRAFT_108458 [Ascodesmis nigricans]|uniref:Uncharacterized protein n=1 Tax=Ascodesmis nigricans TaxID=341454 RepID=A0A4V3SIB7_9PEZI|nr:hypothetical protein EX30DRAFT_108458 [Ascodesmis nigricans]
MHTDSIEIHHPAVWLFIPSIIPCVMSHSIANQTSGLSTVPVYPSRNLSLDAHLSLLSISSHSNLPPPSRSQRIPHNIFRSSSIPSPTIPTPNPLTVARSILSETLSCQVCPPSPSTAAAQPLQVDPASPCHMSSSEPSEI